MSGRDDCIKIRMVKTRDELESVLPLINEANEHFVDLENKSRSNPEVAREPIPWSAGDFESHLVFYAFDGKTDEIVGCVSLRNWHDDERVVVIDDMYVIPAMRRRGIGRMLAEHAIAVAHSNWRHVELGIIEANEPAKKFWKTMLPRKKKVATLYYID